MPPELSNIPINPGVYLFKDERGQILYIGKAIRLRSRVRSYWAKTSWQDRPKLAVLVPQINNIETIITHNEQEALILEANLIYKHQPKYNVLLKGDKNFPWIGITYGESFPRLVSVKDLRSFHRKYPKAKLFGPYLAAHSSYSIISLLRDLFPLRKRSKPLFRDRPCLNYDLGRCLGPCQGLIVESEYAEMLAEIELFLNGKEEELISRLQQKMQRASELIQYEKAAKYRDQIKIITSLSQQHHQENIISQDPDYSCDLIAFAFEGRDFCLQIFRMRQGKLLGRESYFGVLDEMQTEIESLSSVLKEIYVRKSNEDLPPQIIWQKSIAEKIKDFPFFLQSLATKKIKLFTPQRGKKKEQLELVEKNAAIALNSQQTVKDKQLFPLKELQRILSLDKIPSDIDCFDISHLAGTEVVASCVRLSEGLPHKKYYRRIKIKIDQNDDFWAMHEAVIRRYQKHPEQFPDLLLIDGGQGQLNAATEALKELKAEHIPIISLAKREEEIYTSTSKLSLSKDSPPLLVLRRARDEAHRFALKYNRLRRQKNLEQAWESSQSSKTDLNNSSR